MKKWITYSAMVTITTFPLTVEIEDCPEAEDKAIEVFNQMVDEKQFKIDTVDFEPEIKETRHE